jgi:putative ABC transport system permease protein
MRELMQDLRRALRIVRRHPGVSLMASLTLALGIAMNATTFAVFDAVLLRPLPYPSAERLVWLSPHHTRFAHDTQVSRADFVIWREQARSFERMGAYGEQDLAFGVREQVTEVRVTSVTPDVWIMTGARMALGRLPAADERDVVVLSYTTFERLLNGASDVIGMPVTLNGHPMTVVGVLDREYRFAFPAMGDDQESAAFILFPNTAGTPGSPDRPDPKMAPIPGWARVVGRLRPEATIGQAHAEMQTIFDAIAREFPTPLRADRILRVIPLHQKIVGSVDTALRILLVAVGLVMLIATTNIAHLLLGRTISRRTEIAVHRSLGASGLRIMWQLLSEGLVLATVGCVAGLLLATWSLALVVKLWPQGAVRFEDAWLAPRVLTFGILMALASTVLFSLGPGLSLARAPLAASLQDRGGSPGRFAVRVREWLVGIELALATALLIAAGLMIKSFWMMTETRVPPTPERILVTNVALSGLKYERRDAQEQYFSEVLERLEAVPGIGVVGIDSGSFNLPVKIGGTSASAADAAASGTSEGFATFKPVSRGFFQAIGATVVRGRLPADDVFSSDRIESTDAIVVNERFVATMMPGQDPLGRHLKGPYVSGTIAAVVADFKDWQLDAESLPQIYVPFKRSMVLRRVRIVARAESDVDTLAPVIRGTLAKIDPTQPIGALTTLENVLASSVVNRRFNLIMLSSFAGVAFFLALAAAYGVTAYSVAQRKREIGIRMALGAEPRRVVLMIVGHDLRIALIGVLLGVVAMIALSPVTAALLYGVKPHDPLAIAIISSALVAAAAITSLTAASRASAVEPVVALRSEQ